MNTTDKPKEAISKPNLPDPLIPSEITTITDEEEFSDLILDHNNLAGITARNISLKYSFLKSVDLSDGKLIRFRVIDSKFENCSLTNSDWNESAVNITEFIECRMTGWMLNEAEVRDVTITSCKADYSQFQQTKFKRVKFEGCNLSNAYFQGADLTGVIFDGCDLTEADFSKCILKGADFRNSKVSGMRVDLTGLKGAIFDYNQAIYLAQLLGIQIL